MSEPLSAFAVYKANAGDKKKGAKAKKGSPKAGAKITNTVTNGAVKKNNGSPKAKKVQKSKVEAKPTKQVAPRPRSKSIGCGIQANQVDKLVEKLYASSAAGKKLTKAEHAKKLELEEHLVSELKKDDGDKRSENGTNSSDEYTTDSDAGSETNSVQESQEQQPIIKSKASAANKRKNADASENNTKDEKAYSKDKRASAPAKTSEINNHATEPKKAKKKDTSNKVNDFNQNHIKTNHQSTPNSNAKIVKLEPLSPPTNVIKMNSIAEGLKVFRWLLNPISVEDFNEKYWEQGACLIKRNQAYYYQHLISFEAIDQMLLKNHVEFTKNIDITSYKNGVRETLNPEGRAMPPVVWEHYGNGCSIRLLNPHTFLPSLYKLNVTMQEYFHCLVGANAYLTPPNSQGFAPHYDDIEAFVLQIEGRKRWKLYKPRNQSEVLPRYSSPNFDQNEIGKPILEEVLKPGDILYFPRGTIHQACTEPGYHSLHITLSVYQKQSYADLFEKMMPLLLQRTIESSVDMRSGLPLNVWHHAGIAFSENDTKERKEFTDVVRKMLHNMIRHPDVTELIDAAVDQLAKKYQHEALPPEVLPSEAARTIFGSKSTTNERGECVCDYEIDLYTNVRLLRANIMRLVKEEEDKLRIYYYLDNSKEYCEYEPNFIEIEPEDGGSVEVLIKSYPQYIGVSQLPIEDDERKISIVTALWERGLLMMEKPFR